MNLSYPGSSFLVSGRRRFSVTGGPDRLFAQTSAALVGAMQSACSRDALFVGLYILACANGLLGRVLLAVNAYGWSGILVADISVIVWFACFAGVSTMLHGTREEIRSTDLAVGGAVLIFVIVPIFALSWVAITGLSLYILFFASSSPSRRRGALILLALTVAMLWGRLVFQLFTRPILEIDSWLAALLLGTERIGNMVAFADGSGYMVVLPACSSFANVSLAFLCFVSITQWANHRWSAIDIVWSLLSCASVIAVNVTRIALTGVSQSQYETIHNPLGTNMAGAIILGLALGFSLISARRELFAHAQMVRPTAASAYARLEGGAASRSLRRT